jgi:LysR family glycine cleavage system transcriptional activator
MSARRELPSIDSLRYFEAAARTLRFREAARACALTPTAFGQRIRKLEEDLGVELFARTTRHVQLTRSGLALLPLARKCLLAAEACARIADGPGEGHQALELTLGTRHELGLSFVVPALEAVQERVKGLELHLYFGSGQDLLLRVRSFDIDCAITSSLLNDPKLDAHKIHREDYVFVGAKKLLEARSFTKPEHAGAHVLLDVSPELPLFRYFRDAERAPALAFAKVIRSGTIEAIRMRTKAGAGVAVLPEYLVREDVAKGRLVRLFPRVRLLHDHFRLVFRKDDARRAIYEDIARAFAAIPLR